VSCDVLYCAFAHIVVILTTLTVLQCNSLLYPPTLKCTPFRRFLHNSHITRLDTHVPLAATMHATLCMLLSSACHFSPLHATLHTTPSCTLPITLSATSLYAV
jgi:hypothetical protein